MSDIRPDHLLERAREALPQAAGAPRQATLRRGVSDAYYALFHQLTDAIARQALRGVESAPVQRYRRTLPHADLKLVSAAVASGTGRVTPAALSNEAKRDPVVRAVAQAVTDLQEERHRADYDHAEVFDARRLSDAIQRAATAVAEIDQSRTQPAMSANLALLALGTHWSRT